MAARKELKNTYYYDISFLCFTEKSESEITEIIGFQPTSFKVKSPQGASEPENGEYLQPTWEQRSKYKSWSSLKKQLNSLLCDALKDKISYSYTSYREVHDAYSRATVNFNGKELIEFSWAEQIARAVETFRLRKEGIKVSYGELEHKWICEGRACDAAFINSVTIYLNTAIEDALNSPNYLLRMFAFMDRRVGKRTLARIRDEVEALPEWVKQFYRIRCEAEGIAIPPRQLYRNIWELSERYPKGSLTKAL